MRSLCHPELNQVSWSGGDPLLSKPEPHVKLDPFPKAAAARSGHFPRIIARSSVLILMNDLLFLTPLSSSVFWRPAEKKAV